MMDLGAPHFGSPVDSPTRIQVGNALGFFHPHTYGFWYTIVYNAHLQLIYLATTSQDLQIYLTTI